MPELRIDPLTGLRTLIAPGRAGRPNAMFSIAPPPPLDTDADPFLEGHEDRPPPELYALRPGGGDPDTPGWTVRVVPNLYPAVLPDAAPPAADANPDLFGAEPATGEHEVIVHSPAPVQCLSDLPREQVVLAADVWRKRMRAHAPTASYVHVLVNERPEAGASLPHTHAQVYALRFTPAAVARERERAGAYAARTMGGNLLADLVQEEVRRRARIVAIDDEAVLLAPWASRVPFQLLVAPRVPRMRFEDDGATGAALLHEGLQRLARHLGASPPLNLWVRTAPRGSEHFCWRIDVLPRLTTMAGLELGTGVHLNVVAPEDAAAALRSA